MAPFEDRCGIDGWSISGGPVDRKAGTSRDTASVGTVSRTRQWIATGSAGVNQRSRLGRSLVPSGAGSSPPSRSGRPCPSSTTRSTGPEPRLARTSTRPRQDRTLFVVSWREVVRTVLGHGRRTYPGVGGQPPSRGRPLDSVGRFRQAIGQGDGRSRVGYDEAWNGVGERSHRGAARLPRSDASGPVRESAQESQRGLEAARATSPPRSIGRSPRWATRSATAGEAGPGAGRSGAGRRRLGHGHGTTNDPPERRSSGPGPAPDEEGASPARRRRPSSAAPLPGEHFQRGSPRPGQVSSSRSVVALSSLRSTPASRSRAARGSAGR